MQWAIRQIVSEFQWRWVTMFDVGSILNKEGVKPHLIQIEIRISIQSIKFELKCKCWFFWCAAALNDAGLFIWMLPRLYNEWAKHRMNWWLQRDEKSSGCNWGKGRCKWTTRRGWIKPWLESIDDIMKSSAKLATSKCEARNFGADVCTQQWPARKEKERTEEAHKERERALK